MARGVCPRLRNAVHLERTPRENGPLGDGSMAGHRWQRLIRDVEGGACVGGAGMQEPSPSTQFSCKPKEALKIRLFFFF